MSKKNYLSPQRIILPSRDNYHYGSQAAKCSFITKAAKMLSVHLWKGFIIFMVICCCKGSDTFAHEDHDHVHDIVSIDRSTIVHLQSVLLAYQNIYSQLIDRKLNGLDFFAQEMADAALRGTRTEPNKSAGRHMMLHTLQGAGILKKSENLQEAQEAFFSISETIAPFFESWPNQLTQYKLKLFICKDNGYHWLQPETLPPIYPYSPGCKEIEELISK